MQRNQTLQRRRIALSRLALGLALVALLQSNCFAGGHGPAPAAEEEDEFASDAKIRGINLGEYRIRAHYPVHAQKSTVQFEVHASVAKEDYAEAKHLIETRRHKLRDEIITATRMSPLTIFNDAGLEDFRRLILMRLRRAVPELAADDIYVSDFRLVVKTL